jgi:hypothetical protein
VDYCGKWELSYESEKIAKELATYMRTVGAHLAQTMGVEGAFDRVFDKHLAFVIEKFLDGESAEYTAEILQPGRPIPELPVPPRFET